MDKSKLAILFGLSLAFLFLCCIDVKASDLPYPNYVQQVYIPGSASGTSRNYKFNVGADGIFIKDSVVSVSYASGTASFSFDTGLMAVNNFSVENYYLCDYFTFNTTPWYSASLNYTDNGFDTFSNPVLTVVPYVVINGQKHYLTSGIHNSLNISEVLSDVTVYYGAEVDVVVSFDATYSSEDIIKSYFGSVDLNVTFSGADFNIVGYRYFSSGDNLLNSSIHNQGNSITTTLNNLFSDLSSIISNWKNSLSTQLTSWQSALDAKLDEVVQALGRDYDSSVAESTNTELSGSLDSINAAEGTAMTDAKVDVGNYDTSSVFEFAPAVISSLSLITSFANSFFRASGDLTTALTVLFALVFISAVVGFLRFVK